MKSDESLAEIFTRRLLLGSPIAKRCAAEAVEIVVFGSMSAGLERPDSDIDVLCICNTEYKHKLGTLDLIALPTATTADETWLKSELATHVAEYGRWLVGAGHWKVRTQIGSAALEEKRRRIASFMRFLPHSWSRLEEGFRAKYSTKLRRETQRFLLLERGIPVPPTRVLDQSWAEISRSPFEVSDYLQRLSTHRKDAFMKDLLARIDAHFHSIVSP